MSIETTNKVDTSLVTAGARNDLQTGDVRERPVLAENQAELSRTPATRPLDEETPQLAVDDAEVNTQEIVDAVDNMNEVLEVRGRQLQFTIDEEADRTVISVLDRESGETIRQIPSDDVLRLIARMQEMGSGIDRAVGVLIDSQI